MPRLSYIYSAWLIRILTEFGVNIGGCQTMPNELRNCLALRSCELRISHTAIYGQQQQRHYEYIIIKTLIFFGLGSPIPSTPGAIFSSYL